MTFTGIASSIASNGALARNARMNAPVVSAGRIFGAMPPPTNTPPVAIVRSARFPASAPYASTNDVQRLDAAGAASGRAPPSRSPRTRPAASRSIAAPTRIGVDGAVDVEQARAPRHVFHLRPPVARDEVPQQRDVALGPRREVRVAALPSRWRRSRPFTRCRNASPRPGAGGDDRDVAVRTPGRPACSTWTSDVVAAPAPRRPSPRDRSAGGRATTRSARAIAPASTRPGRVRQAGRRRPRPARPRRSTPTRSSDRRAALASQKRRDHRRQIGEVERARTRARRSGAAGTTCFSNRPSRVVVPPTSPASRFTIDIRFILLHLDAVPPLVRRQRRPIACTVVTQYVTPTEPSRPRRTSCRLYRQAEFARPQGRVRARRARSAAPTADDVNAKTTMVVIGAEGFGWPPAARPGPGRRRAEPEAEEGRGAERGAWRADSDSERR